MFNPKISTALIVGLGSIGLRHLKNLKEINPKLKIIALRHKGDTRDQINSIDYQVSDIEKALSYDPEIAIISNPSSYHTEFSLPLADSGIHLLIEKPISSSIKDVKKLINLAKKRRIKLTVGYNLRFLKSLNFFRQTIQEKTLGKIFSIRCEVGQHLESWRPKTDYRKTVSSQKKLGGGVLLELSHEIDYLSWIFGKISWTSGYLAKKSNLDIDVEDISHCLLGFKDATTGQEIIANLSMDFIRLDPVRICTVIGEKGSLRWNGIANSVENFSKKGDWELVFNDEEKGLDHSYKLQMTHFIECVEEDKEPKVTGISAMETLQTVEAIKRSSQESKSIQIEY